MTVDNAASRVVVVGSGLMGTGIAHGFAVLGDHALMAYLTTSAHDPELDDGVRWDSAGVLWPYRDPIVSERDRSLLPLSRLASPFTLDATEGSPGWHGA